MKGWKGWTALALLLLLAAGGILLINSQWVTPHWWADAHWLQERAMRLEGWGFWVILAAQIFQTVLAPIPGHMVGIAAGYLYGVFWGFALCMTGLLIGAALVIWLARKVGRPLVERFVKPQQLAKIDDYLQRRGLVGLLLIYLIPFLPDDLACLAAGLTPLPIWQLLLVTLIGRAPGVLATILMGAQAHALTPDQTLYLVGGALLLTALYLLSRPKLEQAALSLTERFGNASAQERSEDLSNND